MRPGGVESWKEVVAALPGVEVVSEEDLDAVVDVLEAAFAEDAFLVWQSDGDASLVRWTAEYTALYSLRHGGVLAARHEGRLAAVVCFLPPGSSETSASAVQIMETTGLPPVANQRTQLASARIREAHDHVMRGRGPHVHLWMIGSKPAARGKGLGRRLVQAVTSIADWLVAETYLETDSDFNCRFYEKSGFQIDDRFSIERQQFFGMRRPLHQAPFDTAVLDGFHRVRPLPERLLPELLLQLAETHANNVAVYEGDKESVTFAKLSISRKNCFLR